MNNLCPNQKQFLWDDTLPKQPPELLERSMRNTQLIQLEWKDRMKDALRVKVI